ncbi:organic hydroperoxide resistance protein [Actinomadura violacea]|uniref:Organic hydroperoxide resistance protein n=1 Tax=Actinomadura violacea TaxID=2819934 RepID=A0ABS3RV34_9ACTN|nr:organic hydroperoxide resistance protein [Actinomadura violacea]MBO2460627.1 organic hydroperoxide resistance protein [Actinomadura violacea]
MTAPTYTAEARVTGGRNGHGRTADGRLDVTLRLPKEMGGDGEGVNPEQLFAIGYAACFGSTMSVLGQRKGLAADDAEIDARAMLIPTDGGPFKLGVVLDVTLPSLADAEAVGLGRAAHRLCPYSSAIRGNVDVAIVVNGTRL